MTGAENEGTLAPTAPPMIRLGRTSFAPAFLLDRQRLGYLALALAFFVLVIPLVLGPTLDVFDERDESLFHYPTILAIADQLPTPDVAHYDSATTPLYHVLLALPARVFGLGLIPLRFISSLLSLACLLVVYAYLSRRGSKLRALYFVALLFLSPYFIGSAIRLSTDNLAILFALLSIRTMEVQPPGVWSALAANLLILLTVLTRQIYIWLIGAYLLFTFQSRPRGQALWRAMAYSFPVLIPAGALFYFVATWNGFTPPDFAVHQANPLNWDVPVYIGALLGLYGLFFVVWLASIWAQNRRRILPIVLSVALAWSYLLLNPVSNSYDRVNRGGALWSLLSGMPTLFSTAVVYWLLFPLGLICGFILIQHVLRRQEPLMATCFVVWIVANMTNARVYQKYYEPLILFFLGYCLVTAPRAGRLSWIGPLFLLSGLAVLTLFGFF